MSTKTKAAKMKRRRLKEKDKIAFEKQLVREGKIYPRAHYMPRGRFRSILAICLAFFFGIFAGVGALVGTGAYFGLTKKTKDIMSTFGLPADKYLEEAYLDMTVLELLDAVRQDLGAFGGFTTLTLSVFGKYTPVVSDAINSLTDQLKTSLGVEFDKDELMNETFGTIVPYLTDNIKATPLGTMLMAMDQNPFEGSVQPTAEEVPSEPEQGGEAEAPEGSESSGSDMHALLRVLCYGEAGIDYPVDADGKPTYIYEKDKDGNDIMVGIVMNEGHTPTTIGDLLGGGLQERLDKVQTLRLGEIITIDKKASPIMQKLRDMTIQDMQDDETIQNFKIKEIIDVKDGEKGLLNAIADFTIGDLNKPKKIERLRLSDIMDIGESSSKIMQAMKDWRIGDLTSQKKIDSLTLSDVMDIGDGNGILNAIRDTPIGKLETTIGTLSLGEILGEDSGAKNNKILKCLLNSTIDTLSFDVDKLTVGQVFGDEVFSYMKNETVNGVVHDYNYLFKSYFGEQKGNPGSYNYELPDYNQKEFVNGKYEEKPSATLYRPTAVADKSGILTKYQDASKNEVVKGYFTYDETTKLYTHYTDDKELVKYNAANNKENQENADSKEPDPDYKTKPIYYYEQKHDLYPVYGFGIVDETTGGFAPLTNVNTSGEEPTFEMEVPAEEGEGTVTVTYTIHQKGNGDYVYGTYTEEGEFEAVGDIEYYILGYVTDEAHTDLDFEVVYGAKDESTYFDINDATVYHYEADGEYGEDSKAIEVHTRRPAAVPPQTGEGEEAGGTGSAGEPQAHSEGEEAPYYYSEPINLYEKWHIKDNTESTVDDKDVTEVYVSEDGNTTYSRYLSGVWYMLLGGEDEEGNPVVNDTVPVTQMDQMVTGVTDTMQDTILARLWFHGIVQENPFVEFTFLKTLEDLGAKDHTLELEVPVLKGNSKIPYDEQQYPTEQGYTNKGGFVYQKKTITNLVQIGLGDLVTVMQRINEMLASIQSGGGSSSGGGVGGD